MRILRLDRSGRAEWGPRVQALESSAEYPLGGDRFRVDHGRDYFAFFDRLGEVRYYVAEEEGRAIAVACGVVRRVPVGARTREAWYLCDLKVDPRARGRRIPLAMLRRAFLPGYWRCRRGYGITMNPGDGSPNRVVRLAGRFRWAPIRPAATLLLFSLDAGAMRRAQPVVERHRGPTGYLSLAGVKDIVLASTGAPTPLLHVQFGPCAEPAFHEPQAGSVHMLCAPEGDPLARDLAALGHAPSATATVVQHGMSAADWRFVLTSDI